MMTDTEQRHAAHNFVQYWTGKGYEKGESQKFWLGLLQDVLGAPRDPGFIIFEDQVMLDHTSFIDARIPSTRVLIEQKGLGKNLNQAIKQSDGSFLTPFQQAKRYIVEMAVDEHPRWVVTCNFAEFYIYDMNMPQGEPEKILLKDLETEYYRLRFLVENTSIPYPPEEISLKAGEIVGALYDGLLVRYKDPHSPETLRNLNILCVRLVFCLYAEDAGIFGSHTLFHDYIEAVPPNGVRTAIRSLFRILNQKPEDRDPYLADDNALLASFPYVNGGLFKDDSTEIPPFDEELKILLLSRASGFHWSEISPTIFGAVFESTLNPETRRSGGMHYTSIENIHKVIDPLFLDDIRKEFEAVKAVPVLKTRQVRLKAFQEKLASLTFLDPACGSGNFLTETYLCLRRIENEVIALINQGQIIMGDMNPIKVSIGQFYGIEINDFAVSVAKTALWIAESQMMQKTEDVVHMELEFLPLRSYANIDEGNALRRDWSKLVPKGKLNYIMGNPPFVGFKFATPEQKQDMREVFSEIKPALLDYVCCWYKKAAEFIQATSCEVAFVSTNSVSQGQMAGDLWSLLLNQYSISINFAWQSFVWNSESTDAANVHVVVVGFSASPRAKKLLYSDSGCKVASNISPYLFDGPNTLITSRKTPLCHAPAIMMGNQAMDGGNLIIEAADYQDFIACEPKALPFIKRYMMGYEFINNKPRWCLWLTDCSPAQLHSMPHVMKRVNAVREMRAASHDPGARRKAETPMLFREQRNPSRFIAIPIVSSEDRRYIPMGYLDDTVIAGNKLFIIPDASLYHFGVLTSSAHMAWMRAVAARLKSDYTYSKDIVYNNFPWPEATDEQQAKIAQAAQAILDARALYPDCSLAVLYNQNSMPQELHTAHHLNDCAVLKAYGLPATATEPEIVAFLMKRYQELT